MAYEKQNWENGDVITAEKLNHMEDGIAEGGILFVGFSDIETETTLNKTWQEIHDALVNGNRVIVYNGNEDFATNGFVTYCGRHENGSGQQVFAVITLSGFDEASIVNYETQTRNGYPVVRDQ